MFAAPQSRFPDSHLLHTLSHHAPPVMDRPEPHLPAPARALSDNARRAAEQASKSDALDRLARAGYAVKGGLYAAVGLLALQLAFGSGGGETTGTQGVMQRVAGGTFGSLLLVLIGVGLAGYALWRFAEAVLDARHRGSDAGGTLRRLGYFVSGLIHAGLSVEAFRLLLGGGKSSSEGGASDWTATLLAQPFGPWLVGAVALVVIGVGVYQFKKAASGDFMEQLRLTGLGASARQAVARTGQFGIGARGVVFLVVGWFLVQAAWTSDASEARGLGGALDALAGAGYGPWLLAVVAAGLVAYGAYGFVRARYGQFARG